MGFFSILKAVAPVLADVQNFSKFPEVVLMDWGI
jgi:hypothetical protein